MRVLPGHGLKIATIPVDLGTTAASESARSPLKRIAIRVLLARADSQLKLQATEVQKSQAAPPALNVLEGCAVANEVA